MAVTCGRCDFVGPEFPWEAGDREIHRALHGLGRVFLEWLDPIVEAIGARAVKVKPLADLDFKIPELPPIAVELPEVRLVMGGLDVGRARLDGGAMQGEVLDAGAIAQLRAGLLGGMSISTRPEDWAPGARAIIWPEADK